MSKVAYSRLHHALRAAAAAGLVTSAIGCDRSTDQAGIKPRPPGSITYAIDIAPIVQEHCVVCHRPEQSAPFALVSYADVKKRANQIATVTQDRFMPPWLPENGHGEFADCRRLADQQIALIKQWAEEGAIEGDASRTPALKSWPAGWQLGTPDLVLQMPQPYTLSASGVNVFRNFVIPVPLDASRHVRAIEIRPGNARIVHHANVKIDAARTARSRDAIDEEIGFDGMQAVEADFPDGHILGWTPGRVPSHGTPGMAWRLPAGADLVLMLHMVPSGKPEQIQPMIGLYFTDEPPRLHPYSLRLGSQTIDIPAGRGDYDVIDNYVLPVDVELLAIYPHAHFLARSMEALAVLPDGTQRPLIRIPNWDFNWQDEYRCAKPVSLPRGSTLRMKYEYDNSAANPRNPNRPPVRVMYGPQSQDEMGDLWLQVLPRNQQDFAMLKQDFLAKELLAEIAGIEQLVRSNPQDAPMRATLAQRYIHAGRIDDAVAELRQAVKTDPKLAAAHTNLGVILQMRGQLDDALACFRQALEADAQSAEAHLNMGLALQAKGSADDALAEFRKALELRPSLAAAQVALGNACQSKGQSDEAIDHYRKALAINMDDAITRHNLGSLLLARGETKEALEHLQRAVELNSDRVETRINMAMALRQSGQPDLALIEYREAIRLGPDRPAALIGAARILATHPDASKRNAREAVQLAERAVQMTNQRDVLALDTLAAAYACAGTFDKAVTAQQASISLASAAKASPATISDLQNRLALYRQRKPFVEEINSDRVVQLENGDK